MQCESNSCVVLYGIFKGDGLMQSEMFALLPDRKDLRKGKSLAFFCFYTSTIYRKIILQVWNKKSFLLYFWDKKFEFCEFGERYLNLIAFV